MYGDGLIADQKPLSRLSKVVSPASFVFGANTFSGMHASLAWFALLRHVAYTKRIFETTAENLSIEFVFLVFPQECLVGRMKGCHMYNGGAFFEAIMSIARPFIKKKFMERVSVLSVQMLRF